MGWLTVDQVAADMGIGPQNLRVQIRKDRDAVGFPVSIIGSRIYIPQEGYERFKKGLGNEGLQIFPQDDEAV